MAYLIFSLSLLLIYIGLAQMLHVQFGLLGIPNFGVVGFWGLGMYAVGVMQVQFGMSFVDSMVLTVGLLVVFSYILGRLILRLERQAILCATIAFSAIIALLAVTEKWMTMGVVGLGTVRQPFRIFDIEELLFFLFLIALIVGLQIFILKLHKSHLGRLMIAIRDNEELAASLGKDTYQVKIIAFTLTATVMGVLGGLSAPLNQFLTPNLIVPSLTFAVWIALVLGGKEHALGAMLGVFVTFGLFDILIETYVPVTPGIAVLVPNLKLFLYGALLVGVLVFRPSGILDQNTKPEHVSAAFGTGATTALAGLSRGLNYAAKSLDRQVNKDKKEDDA